MLRLNRSPKFDRLREERIINIAMMMDTAELAQSFYNDHSETRKGEK